MPAVEPLDLLSELESTFRLVRTIADEARTANNPKLALLAAQRVATLAELVARLRGELREGARVAIHLSPEFAHVQRTLLDILEPHPQLRAQVARALLAAGDVTNDAADRR